MFRITLLPLLWATCLKWIKPMFFSDFIDTHDNQHKETKPASIPAVIKRILINGFWFWTGWGAMSGLLPSSLFWF